MRRYLIHRAPPSDAVLERALPSFPWQSYVSHLPPGDPRRRTPRNVCPALRPPRKAREHGAPGPLPFPIATLTAMRIRANHVLLTKRQRTIAVINSRVKRL